jgi:hypothetical protein
VRYVPSLLKGIYGNPESWGYTQRGLMDVAKWKREGTKVVFTKEVRGDKGIVGKEREKF